MRIGFDAKRLFNNFTGLGNYSRFVVNALIDHAPENDYLLYTPKVKTHPDITAITSREHVSVITPPSTFKIMGASSLWRSWGISKESTVSSLSIFHGLSQELPLNLPPQIKKVVTVHDLIFLRFPQLYNKIDVSIYKAKVSKACQMADEIIAISHQTADDLTAFLNVPQSRIKVVYQGCHQQFRQTLAPDAIDAIRTKYDLPNQYVLNVGTMEERKNVLAAINALSALPQEIPFVIVGRETAYKEIVLREAEKLDMLDQLIFLHNVPFSDLPAMYQGASVFLYPSLFEGFGIPIVEAMESGVPVISSTGSCFQEAGGRDSIYVDPARPDEMAFHLRRVLEDDSLRQTMIDRGKAYVEKFRPERIAHDLLAVYNIG